MAMAKMVDRRVTMDAATDEASTIGKNDRTCSWQGDSEEADAYSMLLPLDTMLLRSSWHSTRCSTRFIGAFAHVVT